MLDPCGGHLADSKKPVHPSKSFVLLSDSNANNIIALAFRSAGSRVRRAPRAYFGRRLYSMPA